MILPRQFVVGACAALLLLNPSVGRSETADDPKQAEVLVLGLYHFSNPGRDVHNTEVDDVLTPRRQADIVELMDVLRKFEPTKVAVEAGFNSTRIPDRYAAYLAGEHELSRNETEQIGFRLAKQLGHATVYPVDTDGEFPYLRLMKYMQATGREDEFERLREKGAARSRAESEAFAGQSLLENLLYMNSDERIRASMDDYFLFAEWGENWDWAGADLVSDWFRRNMRIYTNIANLADSSGERILVVYGAGHLGWLQFAFDGSTRFRLRRLSEFVTD